MNQEEQSQQNREKLGALAMAMIDDLEGDFEDPALGDCLIICEVFHGGVPDEEYIQRVDPHNPNQPDVPRQRSYIKFRATTWRPVIIEGLITGSAKVFEADSD